MIRPATIGEMDDVTRLALDSNRHWGYDDDFMERCRGELTVRGDDVRQGSVFVAVGTDGGDIIGFYLLRDIDEICVELDMLFVSSAHLDQGVGRALMAHAVNLARTWDRATVRIESDPFAASFYEHEGAALVGWERSISTGRELPVYELSLRT